MSSTRRPADTNTLAKRHGLPEPVYVTRTHLPDLDHYVELLRKAWKTRWVTNRGELHEAFEERLASFMNAPYLSLHGNGTLSLMLAVRALGLGGKVITTPFTFPATPHVLTWLGIEPVFCDIAPETFTLDPARLEELITEDTTGILAVHVYGYPCGVESLGRTAAEHGLRLIYDAAHAVGVRVGGRPITDFGDASAFSLHATKLLHTGEGGALAVGSLEMKQRVDLMRNFGIAGEETVLLPGINAKMNELQAALGLLELERLPDEIRNRKERFERYRESLGNKPGLRLPPEPRGFEHNYSYFPVLVDAGEGITRDVLHEGLKAFNVHTRKYFHPLCSAYPHYRSLPSAAPENLPVATRVAESVLCLPLYGELPLETVDRICYIIGLLLES